MWTFGAHKCSQTLTRLHISLRCFTPAGLIISSPLVSEVIQSVLLKQAYGSCLSSAPDWLLSRLHPLCSSIVTRLLFHQQHSPLSTRPFSCLPCSSKQCHLQPLLPFEVKAAVPRDLFTHMCLLSFQTRIY